MINNDSILNQLNNYKKLNNAGVGITMRSYPTYVERYYPINTEDNIKILKVYKYVDNNDPIELEFKKTQLFEWVYEQQQAVDSKINPLEGYLILFNQIEAASPATWKAGLGIVFSVNGGEPITYPIEFRTACLLDLSPTVDYLETLSQNINNVVVNIEGSNMSVLYDDENEYPVNKGFVSTNSIIYLNNDYVGTYTNFTINYNVNDIQCSTSLNIFPVYFANQS